MSIEKYLLAMQDPNKIVIAVENGSPLIVKEIKKTIIENCYQILTTTYGNRFEIHAVNLHVLKVTS